MLGIIIGVGAVIAMVSLGLGMQEKVKENISSMGSNLLIVMSGGRTANGQRIASGSGAHLTYDDAKAIEKNVDGIKIRGAWRTKQLPACCGKPKLEYAGPGHDA